MRIREVALRVVQPIAHRCPYVRGRGILYRLARPRVFDIPEGQIVVSRYGTRFRVLRDLMYLDLWFWGEYERWQSRTYLRLVKPGDVCVDVGANFGWYSALLARRVGPTGHVYAFEPLPSIARLTTDAIHLNGIIDTVTLEQLALGAAEGEIVVHTFDGLPHGHASVSDLGRQDAKPVACAVTTLDRYLSARGVSRVDFVKIDVEGYEREVLLGAAGMLSRPDAPIVTFEVNVECLRARGVQATEVQEVLARAGYTEFWAVRGARWLEPLLHRVPLGVNADYVATKPARAAEARRLAGGS